MAITESEGSLQSKLGSGEIRLAPPFVGVRIDLDGEIRARAPRDVRLDLDTDPPRLAWRFYGGWKQGPKIRGCINAFLKIAHDPSPECILRFASDYGVMGTCEKHDMPGTHLGCYPNGISTPKFDIRPANMSHNPEVRREAETIPEDLLVFDQDAEASELLDKFRFFAEWASDLVVSASDLMAGRPTSEENWRHFQLYKFNRAAAEQSKTPVDDHREWQLKLASDRLSHWLSMANVRPSCFWDYEAAGGNSDPNTPLFPRQVRLSLIEEQFAGSIGQASFTPPPALY